MDLTVIICTHNPREDYLRRTLTALRRQTFSVDKWDLLLIDNASKTPLSETYDLSWHVNARHIWEDELGLTPARLRGMRESSSPLLIFVDDDNLLDANYLKTAAAIMGKMPWLGAIGGSIFPEYEVAPPEWLLAHERCLAIRRPTVSKWSNSLDDWETQPWGAGLVIRRAVCEVYSEKLQKDGRRRTLDRRGASLLSGGDTDMVFTCTDLDLGFGVFVELTITHLIPPQRLEKDYVLNITRKLAASGYILNDIWGREVKIQTPSHLIDRCRSIYHYLRRSEFQKQIDRSLEAAREDYVEWKSA